jgi:hypothetical protein
MNFVKVEARGVANHVAFIATDQGDSGSLTVLQA